MDSIAAFALGEANKEKPMMVFDWDKAVKIIKDRGLRNCGAGLADDFEWTAGMILVDGKPYMDDYTFLASTWATPQLIVYNDVDDGISGHEEVIDCYIVSSETQYDAGTKFPPHLIKLFD